MPENKGRKFIFWVDLECTGSGDDEDILELGAVITDRELNELDARTYVFPIDPEKDDAMSDVVVRMHTQNGLLDESRDLWRLHGEKYLFTAKVDAELADWVKSYAGNYHMPIAGSGIAHYDRKYIKRDLPLLNKRLTYWPLDVGVIRRSLDLAGVTLPDLHRGKTHRGEDDARCHIQEMRNFVNWAKHAYTFNPGGNPLAEV